MKRLKIEARGKFIVAHDFLLKDKLFLHIGRKDAIGRSIRGVTVFLTPKKVLRLSDYLHAWAIGQRAKGKKVR